MPTFGAKTIADIVNDISGNPAMETLDVSGNASVKMKSTEALEQFATHLKDHKGIKTVKLEDCHITDPGCAVLADILTQNHTIENLVLEKNNITSDGAKMLADGLAQNHGVKTLNLLQQSVKSFGDECLEHFISMYNNNTTLVRITWRLDSRKSFMLAKLQTRNIEIAKRQASGKDFTDLLPDHLKASPPDMTKSGDERAKRAPLTKRASIDDIQVHLDALNEAGVPDHHEEDHEPEKESKGDSAPAAEGEAAAEGEKAVEGGSAPAAEGEKPAVEGEEATEEEAAKKE